ncbi:hypothetical protein ACA910_007628 [Epithemia clementina (nom. ined.)]
MAPCLALNKVWILAWTLGKNSVNNTEFRFCFFVWHSANSPISDPPACTLFASLRTAAASSSTPLVGTGDPVVLSSSFSGFGLGVLVPGGGSTQASQSPELPIPPPSVLAARAAAKTGGLFDSELWGADAPKGTLTSKGVLFCETVVENPDARDSSKCVFDWKPTADNHSPMTQIGLALSVNLQDIQRPANAVQLVLHDVVSPMECGAPVGSSGRFCLSSKTGCTIKSHKCARPSDGLKRKSKVPSKLSSFQHQESTSRPRCS